VFSVQPWEGGYAKVGMQEPRKSANNMAPDFIWAFQKFSV